MLNFQKDKQAYDTHHNYISCLTGLSNGLQLNSTKKLRTANMPFVDEKKNLIELTKKSLTDEYKIVQVDKEYSFASTSWLPIKSYYLIFNVLITAEYMFTLQKQSFNSGHTKCIRIFTNKLRTGEIQFTENIFNEVFDKSILQFRMQSGSNLSAKTKPADMYKMAIRKIARYKVEEWKRKNRIMNLRTKANKDKYNSFLKTFQVSIFDFPYYMRIRANYRDFAFIEGVNTDDTANYFNKYYAFTVNFVKSIEYLNKQITKQRSISF